MTPLDMKQEEILLKPIVKGLNKFVYGGYVLLRNLAAFCLLSIFFAITCGIVSRYIFNSPFTWTEELTCFMMVHICFLSAAVTTATDNHIVADFIVTKFSPKVQIIVKQFGRVLQLFFDTVLVVSSIMMLSKLTWRSPALSIPKQWYYASAIVGGIYMFITVFTQILNDFFPGYDLIKIKQNEKIAAVAAAEEAEAKLMMENMDSFMATSGIELPFCEKKEEGE